MKRAISIADRATLPALALLVALHMLFLLVFAAISFTAISRAQADDAPACTGKDMLAALEKNDPELAAKIKAEAAATLNGKGLLWRIDKPGHAPSFLFGTMHMTDPRVVSLTPEAIEAFDSAATVVIETTEILDPSKMMAGLMHEPELTMFTDDTTLMSLLSPQDAEVVAQALQARGIPPQSVSKMKPWMLAAMVTLPACELARKASGTQILDIKLARDAQAAGKELDGLETVADQLRAMASLPIDFHMKGLVETLKLGDRMDDITETMIVLYKNGDTGMFWPLFHAVLPGDDDDDTDYAAFEEAMIIARNKVMAERAGPILARGNAFIAVGAMHLPGPDGLIELLRGQGFSATSID